MTRTAHAVKLVWLFLAVALLPAAAEPIRSIEFVGLEHVRADVLRLAIRSREGQPVDAERLRGDLNTLMALGVFDPNDPETRVAVEPTMAEGGAPPGVADSVRVVFHLRENPVITEVVPLGVSALPEEPVRDAIAAELRVGEIYNLSLASRAIDQVVGLYAAAGLSAIVSGVRISAAGRLEVQVVEARIGSFELSVGPPVTVDVAALTARIGASPGAPYSRRQLAGAAAWLRRTGLFIEVAAPPPPPGDSVAALHITITAKPREWPRPDAEAISYIDPQAAITALPYYDPVPSLAYTLAPPPTADELDAALAAVAGDVTDPEPCLRLAILAGRQGSQRAATLADEAADRYLAALAAQPEADPAIRAGAARALILGGRWVEADGVVAPLLDAEEPTVRGASVLVETAAMRLARAVAGVGDPLPEPTTLEAGVATLTEALDPRDTRIADAASDYARTISQVWRYLGDLDDEAVCAEVSEYVRCRLVLDLLAPANAALGVDTTPTTPLTSGLTDPRVERGLRARAAAPGDGEARYALARLLMIRALVARLGGTDTARALGFVSEAAIDAGASEAEGLFRGLLEADPKGFASAAEGLGACLIVRGQVAEGRRWLYGALAQGSAREAVGIIYGTTRAESFLRDAGPAQIELARRDVVAEVRAFCQEQGPAAEGAGIVGLHAMSALWVGDFEEAERAVAPLVHPGSETAEGLAMLGTIRLKQGRSAEAVAAFEAAVGKARTDQAVAALGLAKLAAGDAAGAELEFASIEAPRLDAFPL
jgi:tetratricopeptide (TPR) repeat protein